MRYTRDEFGIVGYEEYALENDSKECSREGVGYRVVVKDGRACYIHTDNEEVMEWFTSRVPFHLNCRIALNIEVDSGLDVARERIAVTSFNPLYMFIGQVKLCKKIGRTVFETNPNGNVHVKLYVDDLDRVEDAILAVNEIEKLYFDITRYQEDVTSRFIDELDISSRVMDLVNYSGEKKKKRVKR